MTPEISEDLIAYHEGAFRPLADARVSVATHAFNYGTAVFEGIRGYWNGDARQLYLFRPREHFARLAASCRLLHLEPALGADALVELCRELLRRNGFATDVYVRPIAYHATRSIRVVLRGMRSGLSMFAFPIGDYLSRTGIVARTASWRRVADDALPARGKIAGAYVNTALAVDDAQEGGADEALLLTRDGLVSEGGGANVFIVRGGALITPRVSDDILEGITRSSLITLAREELGLTVSERAIHRSELLLADEVLFCGTGAQVAPCVAVDGRPIGSGSIGPVAAALAARYEAVVRGTTGDRAEWRVGVL